MDMNIEEQKEFVKMRSEQARAILRQRLAFAVSQQEETVTTEDVAKARAALEQPNLRAVMMVAVYDEPHPETGKPGMGAAISIQASEEAQHIILKLMELEVRTMEVLHDLDRKAKPEEDTCPCPGCARRRAREAMQNTTGPTKEQLQEYFGAVLGDGAEGVTVVLLKADGPFGPERYEPEPEGGDTAH